MVPKARHDDILGRYREIISDPVNLLVRRVPPAGTVKDNLVVLHNGHLVPISGDHAYYDDFSNILVLNRGVHEPVEEYAFQCLTAVLPKAPVMLELGAMWAHYSMWMLLARPDGRAFMVEPDPVGLAAGKQNFARNGYTGTFEQGLIGPQDITVDDYMARHGIDRLTILHSDIQGAEVDMLEGAKRAFAEQRIDYAFVSTHGQPRHQKVHDRLQSFGYRIEVDSPFATATTSHDGLVVAVRPDLPGFMPDLPLLGRQALNDATPDELVAYLARLQGVIRSNTGRPRSGPVAWLRQFLGQTE